MGHSAKKSMITNQEDISEGEIISILQCHEITLKTRFPKDAHPFLTITHFVIAVIDWLLIDYRYRCHVKMDSPNWGPQVPIFMGKWEWGPASLFS